MAASNFGRKATVTEDIGLRIERWQTGVSTRKDDEPGAGPIGSLYNSIKELLACMLIDLKTRSNFSQHYQSVESSCAALVFWGTDFDVSRGALDEALHGSLQLRDTCLSLLVSIGQFLISSFVCMLSNKDRQEGLLKSAAIVPCLEQAMNIVDQQDHPSYQPEHDEEMLCRTLRFKIDNLITLGSSLASPAEDSFDNQEPQTVESLEEHRPEKVYINSVAQRFPRAASATVNHLGKLNWQRYDHVLQLQRTATQQELETVAIEKARTIFQDSALGSSVPAQSEAGLNILENASSTQSTYVPSVISSRAEASHKRLPPLSTEARSGLPFTCVVCNMQVKYQRTKAWKKHIFGDILAYACPFADCCIAEVFFQDRHAMMDHLEQSHDLNPSVHTVMCPLCFEYSSSDRDALSLHIARHMEEVALAILPSGVDSVNDSASDSPSETETVTENGSLVRRSSPGSRKGTPTPPPPSHFPRISPDPLLISPTPLKWNVSVAADYGSDQESIADAFKGEQPSYRYAQTPSQTDRFGATRLARECEKGDLDAVKQAYNDAPDELDQVDYAGVSPLQKAALNGHTLVVSYLIERGCDTNCRSNDLDTPLIDAVENGHFDIVELLLNKANVDPHHSNKKGQRAIDVVDYGDYHANGIDNLLRAAMKREPFKKEHYAGDSAPETSSMIPKDALPGSTGIEEGTLKHKRERRTQFWSPIRAKIIKRKEERSLRERIHILIQKVEEGDIKAVEKLMNSNVKPNLACGIAAARGGHNDILSILLAAGLRAHYDISKTSETPMTVAIERGHSKIVELLLEHDGFNPDISDRQGRTCYDLAEKNRAGDWQQTLYLIQHACALYKVRAEMPTTKRKDWTETSSMPPNPLTTADPESSTSANPRSRGRLIEQEFQRRKADGEAEEEESQDRHTRTVEEGTAAASLMTPIQGAREYPAQSSTAADVQALLDSLTPATNNATSARPQEEPRRNLTSSYQCPVCGTIFRHSINRTVHLQKHLKKGPYACPFPGCTEVLHVAEKIVSHAITHQNPDLTEEQTKEE